MGGLIRIHVLQDCTMNSSNNNMITAKRLTDPIYRKYLSESTSTCTEEPKLCVKARLHQASASTQSQCCDDPCDIALIEINGNKQSHS